MTACTVLGMACARQHGGRLPVWFACLMSTGSSAVQVYLGALPA
jgi:hypothetical protein